MTLFGLFGDKKKDEYKQFEKYFKHAWAKRSVQRQADKRNAFLTPALLRERRNLTNNGKQKLVLDFGIQGGKVSYTLADLNRMATAMEKAEGKFGESVRGVTVSDLIRASKKIDITRAKQISNSTLYKFDGSILLFRVTSQSNKGYHQVKIKLEDWEHEVRNGEGAAYLPAAMKALRGHVSFDCDCGRHQYWYRYLATIGGFALDPKEFAFPKIRNPKLQGCCCKHVLKTLAVMQTPFIQSRVALEMKDQATKKGWFSRRLHGDRPTETFMTAKELRTSEASGSVDIQKAFADMKKAKESFGQKMKNILTGAKRGGKKMADLIGKGTVADVAATHLAKENVKLKRDMAVQKMATALAIKIHRDKMGKDDAIKSYARENKINLKEAKEMAKQVNV